MILFTFAVLIYCLTFFQIENMELMSTYEAPTIEIIPIESECVMINSGSSAAPSSDGNTPYLRSPYGNRTSTTSYDLNDMINDILTAEQ
jgi:hypothetical protein